MRIHHPKIMISLLAIAFISIGSSKAHKAPERNQLFDSNWKFCLGAQPKASSPTFDDSNWRVLDLPHDWSIEGNIEKSNPMGGAGGYFLAPSTWKGKCVTMCFDGVYRNAEVFINGKSLGMHPYGYTAFNLDLTPYLIFSEANTIAVHVDNSKQINCRWYSGSGIYRHVRMRVTGPIHLKQWGTFITTPEVSPVKASVKIRTVVKNETDQQIPF